MIRVPAVPLLAAALALSSCSREELPPGAGFLRHVQPDAEVLLYADDLLPHLRAALASEALMGLLQEIPLFRDTGLEPARLRLQLEAVRTYVPARACFSLPRGGVAAVGAAWRALDAGTRCQRAIAAGGEGLGGAQEDFAAAIGGLRGARASLYAAFRDPRTAESLFDRLLDLRSVWVMNPAFEVEEKLDALELRVDPGSFAETRMFPAVLSEFGLVASREDPGVDLIREAVATLHARITIELVGDGLVCTLGAIRGGDPAELTELWSGDPLPDVYLQWDLGAMQEDLPDPALGTDARPAWMLAAFARTAPTTGSLRIDIDGEGCSLVAEYDRSGSPSLSTLLPLPPDLDETLAIRSDLQLLDDRSRSELHISLRR